MFFETRKPPIYFKYVGDTFAIFDHEAEIDKFLTKLNCVYAFLKITFEKEKDKCPSFLDVYLEKTDIGFKTSVYRKPTFTGQYFRWESFSPLKRKIILISTLVHRALIICTKPRLNGEIERIKKYYWTMTILKTIALFSAFKRFGPEKCRVYMKVPWIDKPFTNLEKKSQQQWKAAVVSSALAWF